MVKHKQMLKENMNQPLIHLNRKYHVPLDSIISITQKKWGRIWVAFIDPKTKQKKIAIAKHELSNLMMVINTSKLMRGEKQLTAIKE